jgi:uncharacterized phage-associated protein
MFVDGFSVESYIQGMAERATMIRDGAHDPRAIANKILDIRSETGEPLTIMQLIKLAYIADGWTLALLNKPLANEAPEAWQYGPVFRSVYNAFSGSGSRPVVGRACVRGTQIPISEEFSPEEEAILKMVVNSYGKLSAFTLSNLTHQHGTPWSKAYEKGGVYSDIDTDEMRQHFISLKAKRLVQREHA